MKFCTKSLRQMWDKYKCDSNLLDIRRTELEVKFNSLFALLNISMKAYGRVQITIHILFVPRCCLYIKVWK
jgi:hypothetical protein